MTFTRDQQINPLQANTSFYDWYLKENTEIIDKLNGMSVFGATSGNGISAVVDNNGLLTISFGGASGVISNGITFNGDITFNGFTPLKNITYKISGITAGTSGFTFGTPVYYNETTGYTSGKADTQTTAETIGILSKLTTNESYLTLFGKIEGSFTEVTSDGSSLSPGCIYFLDPTTKGKITTTEPTTNLMVSKPVLLSIDATSGIVLQYRGNYLNSAASGGGITGSNVIYIVIPTVSGLIDQFSVGSVLSCNENLNSTDEDTSDYFALSNRTLFTSNTGNKWFLSKSNNLPNTSIEALKREEDFVVGSIINTSTVGPNTLFSVAVAGGIPFAAGGVNGVYSLRNDFVFGSVGENGQQLILNADGSYLGKIYGIQYDDTNFVIINNPRKTTSALAASFSSESVAGSENILNNGDFSIWQRNSVGRDSGYTGQSNLVFADMWRRRDGITGPSDSKSFSIERSVFSDNDNTIEGDPKYYLTLKALGLSGGTGGLTGPATGYLEIAHIIPDARTLAAQTATLSFYAKCGTANYAIQAYYARYNGTTQLDKTIIDDAITLTTGWIRYDIPFDVGTLPWVSSSNMENDYLEVGFDFNSLIQEANLNSVSLSSSSVNVSIASVCLFLGNIPGMFITNRNINDRLNECRKLYYSSYTSDQRVGTSTMLNGEEPSYNCWDHTISPINYSEVVKWPIEMRVTPTSVVYSPFSGTSSEAYNRMSGRDLRNSSGTLGYNGVPREARRNIPTISTNSTKDGIMVTVMGGAVWYDNIFYHIVANSDYPL